jgi:IS30 family transposase
MSQNDAKGYQCKRCDTYYQTRTMIARHVSVYHPLTQDEKTSIMQLKAEGKTWKAIGEAVDRAPSTVGRYIEIALAAGRNEAPPLRPTRKSPYLRQRERLAGTTITQLSQNPSLLEQVSETLERVVDRGMGAPMLTPAEYVLAFEARCLEYQAILAQKDAEIAELTRACAAKEKEALGAAKQLNELLYRGKSFSDQMAAAGQIINSPLAR